uniref:Uncharacterized protein n=1 Tax=Romanomermis culicivorax TaxID=13658 RepID=A0A915HQA5_ROMCU
MAGFQTHGLGETSILPVECCILKYKTSHCQEEPTTFHNSNLKEETGVQDEDEPYEDPYFSDEKLTCNKLNGSRSSTGTLNRKFLDWTSCLMSDHADTLKF